MTLLALLVLLGPAAATPPLVSAPGGLPVELDRHVALDFDGTRWLLDGASVPDGELLQDLGAVRAGRPDAELLVAVRPATPWARVEGGLEAVRAAGFEGVRVRVASDGAARALSVRLGPDVGGVFEFPDSLPWRTVIARIASEDGRGLDVGPRAVRPAPAIEAPVVTAREPSFDPYRTVPVRREQLVFRKLKRARYPKSETGSRQRILCTAYVTFDDRGEFVLARYLPENDCPEAFRVASEQAWERSRIHAYEVRGRRRAVRVKLTHAFRD